MGSASDDKNSTTLFRVFATCLVLEIPAAVLTFNLPSTSEAARDAAFAAFMIGLVGAISFFAGLIALIWDW